MTIVEIINKKRNKEILDYNELSFAFMGYLNKQVEDYQMSALLMAICIQGMTDQEVIDLTDIFIHSGETMSFGKMSSSLVDKHSTGGVGDKTTLIVGPLVASCGVKVAKMSGRGLGHTGGTIDKLESIPGFSTSLMEDAFMKQVDSIGFALTSQTKNLVPLDQVIYALRDVTGTVESIPLIASSIMSKKIAAGSKKIVIDVKVGRGALIKTEKDANYFCDLVKKIGQHYHVMIETVQSDMETPLGNSIGNSLEVLEAVKILKNEEKGELCDLCVHLASLMVQLGKEISYQEAKELVLEQLYNQQAYRKFLEFVHAQGGDLMNVTVSSNIIPIPSSKSGIIDAIDALKFGQLSVSLGAGRQELSDTIDPTVGIVFNKMLGDRVEKGDILCTLYVNKVEDYSFVENYFILSDPILRKEKVVGTIEEDVFYKIRPSVYGLIFNENHEVAVLEVSGFGFHLPGGAKEFGETSKETLQREFLEETGYTLCDLEYFETLHAYYYLSEVRQHFHSISDFYVGKIGSKEQESVECDHHLKWFSEKEILSQFYFEFHKEALRDYGRLGK